MRIIILAAGQGFQLDGFNTVLIKHPKTGRSIIEQYLEIFDYNQITMVVGYRAINIMHQYPKLHYIYSSKWSVTNNSYSLGLALNDEPCYVVSSDLFIDREAFTMLDEAEPDCILTENREDRILTSLNCSLEGRRITEVYQGEVRSHQDPEAVGVYKMTDRTLLRLWKRNCLRHTNLFNGQNLPLNEEVPTYSVDIGSYNLDEINTPLDYIKLIDKYSSE